MATPQEIQAALVEGKTFMEDLTEYSQKGIVMKNKREVWEKEFWFFTNCEFSTNSVFF